MSIITWSEIEAECGDYRAGFVDTYKLYEGQETDEKDAYDRPVKVTVSSFARHVGIAKTTFQDWIRQADGAPAPSRSENRGAAGAARRFAGKLLAADKAKLAAELLADPEVVDQPEGRLAVAKAAIGAQEREQAHTERKRAGDPVGRRMDENIALLDLQGAINGFVRKATELLPYVGPVAAGEHYWLKGETERLEAVTSEIRYLADHGETRTDTELRTIQTGGA